MEYLVDQGLLIRRRGIGTPWSSQGAAPIQLSSLFDDLRGHRQAAEHLVLSLEVVPATADVADALNLGRGDAGAPDHPPPVSARAPIALMTNYLPRGPARSGSRGAHRAGARRGRAVQGVQVSGIDLHAADQVVGARKATASEAHLLDEPRGAALLTMQRVAYDDFGRVVELSAPTSTPPAATASR